MNNFPLMMEITMKLDKNQINNRDIGSFFREWQKKVLGKKTDQGKKASGNKTR